MFIILTDAKSMRRCRYNVNYIISYEAHNNGKNYISIAIPSSLPMEYILQEVIETPDQIDDIILLANETLQRNLNLIPVGPR